MRHLCAFIVLVVFATPHATEAFVAVRCAAGKSRLLASHWMLHPKPTSPIQVVSPSTPFLRLPQVSRRVSPCLTLPTRRGSRTQQQLTNGSPQSAIVNGNRRVVAEDAQKTQAELKFIKAALLNNVMFTSLPEASLQSLMDSFVRTVAVKDEIIVKQGDSCDDDFAYLLAEGECTVTVDGKVVPEPYGTLKAKSIFGELGVLYNTTRAATVSVKSDEVVLYKVDGNTFKSILNTVTSAQDAEELQRIDDAIKQVEGTKSLYGGDIIGQYRPNRSWLWRRWSGTILKQNYKSTLLNMALCLLLVVVSRLFVAETCPIRMAPDKAHPLIQRLMIIEKLWSYQMGLTTFILTFFVNQAYSFWQEIHSIARRIQGRFNDFNLLLATAAKRKTDGTYTDESEALLEDVGTSSRLMHALFWASCARRFRVLCTPKGLERMASRGLMTSKQLDVLQNLDLPANQKHNACLEWMMLRSWQGLEDGTLRGGYAVAQELMQQMCTLRGTYATIGDKLSARMPLPYTHFVQILVDTFVLMAPFALYAELGAYSVVCVGVITLFYTGLLDLAKIFLDPLDNEDCYQDNSIYMDLGVLVRESNAGSTRWKNAGARLPF